MDLKASLAIFVTVFFAELGDKTQLATVLFASKDDTNQLMVFLAASGALITSTALAVTLGSFLSAHVDTRLLTIAAGIGFILIGAWTLFSALRG